MPLILRHAAVVLWRLRARPLLELAAPVLLVLVPGCLPARVAILAVEGLHAPRHHRRHHRRHCHRRHCRCRCGDHDLLVNGLQPLKMLRPDPWREKIGCSKAGDNDEAYAELPDFSSIGRALHLRSFVLPLLWPNVLVRLLNRVAAPALTDALVARLLHFLRRLETQVPTIRGGARIICAHAVGRPCHNAVVPLASTCCGEGSLLPRRCHGGRHSMTSSCTHSRGRVHGAAGRSARRRHGN
mmetsp:Transcript_54695/g.140825  ORF Transcript_54695/g.140825 Transcript_54695/m.140825 type:complete len:241 (+) Transcript_54695:1048-1770(+)